MKVSVTTKRRRRISDGYEAQLRLSKKAKAEVRSSSPAVVSTIKVYEKVHFWETQTCHSKEKRAQSFGDPQGKRLKQSLTHDVSMIQTTKGVLADDRLSIEVCWKRGSDAAGSCMEKAPDIVDLSVLVKESPAFTFASPPKDSVCIRQKKVAFSSPLVTGEMIIPRQTEDLICAFWNTLPVEWRHMASSFWISFPIDLRHMILTLTNVSLAFAFGIIGLGLFVYLSLKELLARIISLTLKFPGLWPILAMA